MYNLLLYIFQFGVYVAAQFFTKVRTMWRGQNIAVRYLQRHVDPNAEYVWFHAASLGEFEQGRPIMEEYRRVYPNRKILLTFFSPSGYEVNLAAGNSPDFSDDYNLVYGHHMDNGAMFGGLTICPAARPA